MDLSLNLNCRGLHQPRWKPPHLLSRRKFIGRNISEEVARWIWALDLARCASFNAQGKQLALYSKLATLLDNEAIAAVKALEMQLARGLYDPYGGSAQISSHACFCLY